MSQIKGILLADVAEGQNLYVYLCTLDLDVFSAGILDLVGLSSANIAALTDFEELLQEVPGLVSDLKDVEDSLMNIQQNASLLPCVIIDPAMLSFPDFPEIVNLTRTGTYRLKYIDFRPAYRLLNQSTIFDVDLAYTGWIRGYYVKDNEQRLFYPIIPNDPIIKKFPGFKGFFPSEVSGSYDVEVVGAFSNYSLPSFYGVINYIYQWFEGGDVPYWHLLSGEESCFIGVSKGNFGMEFLLNSNNLAAFNADYPAEILEGWIRSFSANTAKITKNVNIDDKMAFPGENGVLIPDVPCAGFGGVLAGVLGIASKTGLLNSVWRRGKNG